jgi:hypothetical protein
MKDAMKGAMKGFFNKTDAMKAGGGAPQDAEKRCDEGVIAACLR